MISLKRTPPVPTPEMARQARQAAEQAAEEHGVGIDQICVRVEARTGEIKAFVLEAEHEEDEE